MLHSLSTWSFDVSSQNWILVFLMFRPISSSLSPVFTWPILSPSSSNCYQTQTRSFDTYKTMCTDNIAWGYNIVQENRHLYLRKKSPHRTCYQHPVSSLWNDHVNLVVHPLVDSLEASLSSKCKQKSRYTILA